MYEGELERLLHGLYDGKIYKAGDCNQVLGREFIEVKYGLTVFADTCKCGDMQIRNERVTDYDLDPRGGETVNHLWLDEEVFDLANGPSCSQVHDLPALSNDSIKYFYARVDAPRTCMGQHCLVEDHFLFIMKKGDSTRIIDWSSIKSFCPIGDINNNGIIDHLSVWATNGDNLYDVSEFEIKVMELDVQGDFQVLKDDQGKDYMILARAEPSWFDGETVRILSHHWMNPIPRDLR